MKMIPDHGEAGVGGAVTWMKAQQWHLTISNSVGKLQFLPSYLEDSLAF